MNIQLSDSFTFKKLIRFTLPSVFMMIFTSIYGVVDGFFVSNIVGKTPFAAVNFIMPVLMMLGAFGFMFGAGGSALIAKTMGEGDIKKANHLFSLFVYVTFILGVTVSLISFFLLPKVAVMLGAEGKLLENVIIYSRILLISLPFFMLQLEFQTFFVTAEKPQLGLISTIVCGVTNMVLDALFVAVFRWGLEGAAFATAISEIIGGFFPVIYFSVSKKSLLHLGKTNFDIKSLIKASINGSSELLSNISMSLVGVLYNIQLLKYAGENGIAAYGVLMYVNFVFISAFIGYSVGTAPVISYHFGAGNSKELKNLLKKSMTVISILAVFMFLTAELMSSTIASLFVGYDKVLFDMTSRAFLIFSFSFLFSGFAIFGSGFFTALNNGLVSAIISFFRTLVFQIGAVLLLPLVWDINGIWASVVVAEIMAFILTFTFIGLKKKKYGY